MRRVYDSTGEITPQLIIKWKPPDFTGGTITNYTVNIKTEVCMLASCIFNVEKA